MKNRDATRVDREGDRVTLVTPTRSLNMSRWPRKVRAIGDFLLIALAVIMLVAAIVHMLSEAGTASVMAWPIQSAVWVLILATAIFVAVVDARGSTHVTIDRDGIAITWHLPQRRLVPVARWRWDRIRRVSISQRVAGSILVQPGISRRPIAVGLDPETQQAVLDFVGQFASTSA